MHKRSNSQDVNGRDGAVVGGSWCKPSQCKGACCCVLHGNTAPPTSHRHTGERVASDHPIALSGSRRGPRKCNAPCFTLSDCEILWWISGGWGGISEILLLGKIILLSISRYVVSQWRLRNGTVGCLTAYTSQMDITIFVNPLATIGYSLQDLLRL